MRIVTSIVLFVTKFTHFFDENQSKYVNFKAENNEIGGFLKWRYFLSLLALPASWSLFILLDVLLRIKPDFH